MIDMDRIAELQGEIGAEDLGLVIGVFLGEAEETLARLTPDLAPTDLGRAAHFLRSGALNIGFRGIAGLAERLKQGEAAEMVAAVAELRAALDLSRQELGMSLV